MFALRRKQLQSLSSGGDDSGVFNDQEEAILRLLTDMRSLAEGDLTIEAKVTEEITGSISDSLNYAVNEMRDLVWQIIDASNQVGKESELASNYATEVSDVNSDQARLIAQVVDKMTNASRILENTSKQAKQSSNMASHSIDVATRGAEAVRATLNGMKDIREQIQETSKRIKRLGESSQRIGDIVILIEEIAEQTNLLSLNAAIQASMAGEAGRGFAIVSEEVRNLAQRSSDATKRIAELVTNIQRDTNNAISSMERATQEVVVGTKVADSAGSALSEIETASSEVSQVVAQIAERSTNQAQLVMDVLEEIHKVSDSSHEASQKAQQTSHVMIQLKTLAQALRHSIDRFKLPSRPSR